MSGSVPIRIVASVVGGVFALGAATTAGAERAAAAAPGRVMAATQLQSAATLNSSLLRWIPAGTSLSLECYVRGQPVQGYYSRWLPNGGWDNLWYRTSGGYVADVDLNTGSNDPVAPQCGTAPVSSREQRALDWANQQAAARSMSYNGLCERFVEQAYGTSGRFTSALAAFNALRARGMVHSNATNIPAGALVFSTGSDPRFGHVMLSRGNGTFVSGGASTQYGNHATVQTFSSPAPSGVFLGWSTAPAEWPGR